MGLRVWSKNPGVELQLDSPCFHTSNRLAQDVFQQLETDGLKIISVTGTTYAHRVGLVPIGTKNLSIGSSYLSPPVAPSHLSGVNPKSETSS